MRPTKLARSSRQTREASLPADHEDPSSQGNAQIQEGKALVDDLAVFVKAINDLNAGRQQDRSGIVAAIGPS